MPKFRLVIATAVVSPLIAVAGIVWSNPANAATPTAAAPVTLGLSASSLGGVATIATLIQNEQAEMLLIQQAATTAIASMGLAAESGATAQ